ncbi:MAG: hypothetical protein R2877_04580 [Bdellovibrionota bacterium]
MPQYNQYVGGLDPGASGYYHTPYNMQQVCGNPASVTTFQYSSPCGNLNWNGVITAVNSNNGLNYMRQGNFNQAAGIPMGRADLCRNVRQEFMEPFFLAATSEERTKNLAKVMDSSWTNMKQLKTGVYESPIAAMDRVAAASAAMTGVTAPLTIAAANDYARAGWTQIPPTCTTPKPPLNMKRRWK